MSDMPCPGPCNGASRKALEVWKATAQAHAAAMSRLPDGVEPLPAPQRPDVKFWMGEPVWCGKCASWIRVAVSQLDHLAALRVTQEPDARIAGPEAPVSVSRSRPSPSRMLDDVDELTDWALNWEEIVAGDTAMPRHGFLALVRTEALAWLGERCERILLNPDIAQDFGEEVRGWHRELTEKTRAGTGFKHVKTKCPRCGLFTLYEESGSNYVQCKNNDFQGKGAPCGQLLSREEMADLDDETRAVSKRWQKSARALLPVR